MRLLVVAKAPVPGLVKTRLTPPADPGQAADVAAAALLDTLDLRPAVVAMTGDLRRARRATELRAALRGCRVLGQRGRGLAERLAAAHHDMHVADAHFADAAGAGPVLQVGMDTPQLDPALLAVARDELRGADAVLGPATDGGWWGLGLHDPRHATALLDVPMSTSDTGELTLIALRRRGLRVRLLPELSDVDTMADAVRVARLVPGSRFAAAVGRFAPVSGELSYSSIRHSQAVEPRS